MDLNYVNISQAPYAGSEGYSSNANNYFNYGAPSHHQHQSNTVDQHNYDPHYGGASLPSSQQPQPSRNATFLNSAYDQYDAAAMWAAASTPDLEKGFKFTDKIETIEISSKDLSPASCCSSNIEQLLQTDCSKQSRHRDLFATSTTGSGYGSKYVEYPSCAQQHQNLHGIDKTVKYCSIQNVNIDATFNNANNSTYGSHIPFAQSDIGSFDQYDNLKPIPSTLTCPLPLPTNDFFLFDAISNLEEAPDEDGSDIIVEESDDDDEFSEIMSIPSKCLICNMCYSATGSQFYILTEQSPLTMSTQRPVLAKLIHLIGDIDPESRYLCSHCLGLLNTIDHLELKLAGCKVELAAKYRKPLKSDDAHSKFDTNKCKTWKSCGFYCKFCVKVIRVSAIVRNHMHRHKNRNRFLCERCGKGFLRYKHFLRHAFCHMNSKQNVARYSCGICSKKFKTRFKLKEHVNFCSGTLPHKCIQCDKSFATATKLKSHVRLKHDKKFTSICSICNIGFVKLSAYKSHMISHSTDKKYRCTKCNNAYKTIGNLNYHMKFHDVKLPFTCTICSRGFMRKEYLEAHVNKHVGIKSFACSACDKRFVSQKNLDAHFKCHESSDNKKVCNVCFKEISTRLEEHLRTHANLREFECEKCDMRFNTKGALAKHRKRKHAQVL